MIVQHFSPIMRECRTLIGHGLMLLIALGLSIGASIQPHFPGDLTVARWIQSFGTSRLDTFMESVSYMGGRPISTASIVVLAVGFALARRWQAAITFLGVFAMNGLLAAIKWAVDRPRPSQELVRVMEETFSNGSFPSGHAYYVMLFYGLVLVLVVTSIFPTWLRRGITLLLLVWILLSGVSRVYLGAHWPSDVLGSLALGIPSVALLFYFYQRLKRTGLAFKNSDSL